jgi:hypothetical protein
MTIKRAVIHPLALAIYPALALYTGNAELVTFRDAAGSLFGAALASALGWLLLRLGIRNARKSGSIVFLIILLFCYSPAVMLSLMPFLMRALASRLLTFVLFLLPGIAIWAILRSRSEFLIITPFLNAVALSPLL